jgi:hypothetical protein
MKFNFRTNGSSLILPALLLFSALLISCNNKPKTEHGTDMTSQPGGIAGKGYTDSSASSVRVFDQNGRVCIQQTNTSYEVVTIFQGSTKIPLLLKIRKTELCYADSINHDKMYEISAKSVMDTKAVSWNADFVATEIYFKDNTLLAVKEGNDNEQDFIRRFSLNDGSEVFSCSFSDMEIKIPNVTNKYFIGYTSKKAATDPLSKLKEENLQGVVRFGSSLGAIDSFKVKLKRSKVVDKIASSVPDAVLLASNDNTRAIDDGKTIILMKGDEHTQNKDVSDLAVKFTYYFGDDNESTDITVPVVAGKFDLSRAQYDKDIFEITPF